MDKLYSWACCNRSDAGRAYLVTKAGAIWSQLCCAECGIRSDADASEFWFWLVLVSIATSQQWHVTRGSRCALCLETPADRPHATPTPVAIIPQFTRVRSNRWCHADRRRLDASRTIRLACQTPLHTTPYNWLRRMIINALANRALAGTVKAASTTSGILTGQPACVDKNRARVTSWGAWWVVSQQNKATAAAASLTTERDDGTQNESLQSRISNTSLPTKRNLTETKFSLHNEEVLEIMLPLTIANDQVYLKTLRSNLWTRNAYTSAST